MDCEIEEEVEIPLGEDREQHNTGDGEEKMLGGVDLKGGGQIWLWDSETGHIDVNLDKA